MSIADYARLVASMRRAQKESREWLNDQKMWQAARGWEKQVDAATKEILAPPKLPLGEPS